MYYIIEISYTPPLLFKHIILEISEEDLKLYSMAIPLYNLEKLTKKLWKRMNMELLTMKLGETTAMGPEELQTRIILNLESAVKMVADKTKRPSSKRNCWH